MVIGAEEVPFVLLLAVLDWLYLPDFRLIVVPGLATSSAFCRVLNGALDEPEAESEPEVETKMLGPVDWVGAGVAVLVGAAVAVLVGVATGVVSLPETGAWVGSLVGSAGALPASTTKVTDPS